MLYTVNVLIKFIQQCTSNILNNIYKVYNNNHCNYNRLINILYIIGIILKYVTILYCILKKVILLIFNIILYLYLILIY